MNRFLIDAFELGHNPKGISRVLAGVVPRIAARTTDEVLFACTEAAGDALAGVPAERVVHVRRHLQTRWEQWSLPHLARRLGIDAIYSHRESGALWGPPLVLHVPEDPEIRWKLHPSWSMRTYARRGYSRATMRRALQRAVVAASTPTVATQLSTRFGIPSSSISIVPLGVDLALFTPAEPPAADAVFHLGSSDPRDRTAMVVDAWAEAKDRLDSLPKLVVGGEIGEVTGEVRRRAAELGVDVIVTGRLSDADLASHFRHAAVVLQPSSDEGFGLQPLEAMASGAPLVVTRAGAVTDVVADCAVVCDASPQALAEGIEIALVRAPTLRHAARLRAETFTWEATADAVLDLLRSAAARHPTEPKSSGRRYFS